MIGDAVSIGVDGNATGCFDTVGDSVVVGIGVEVIGDSVVIGVEEARGKHAEVDERVVEADAAIGVVVLVVVEVHPEEVLHSGSECLAYRWCCRYLIVLRNAR